MPDSVTYDGFTTHVGDSVAWIDNGFRFGVVTDITKRRTGGEVLHALTAYGVKRKINIEEAKPVNDGRMRKLRAMTPAEAAPVRAAYLKKFLKHAEKTRIEWQADRDDSPESSTPKPRGRTNVPASDDNVQAFIDAVTTLKVASKSQILSKIGDLSASQWNKTIEAALATGKVERHGERRGAKYTLPGFKVEKVEPKDDVQVQEYADKVLAHMQRGQTGVYSRAQIMNLLPTDNATYQAAMKLLADEDKIIKTGAKRGTKYHVA